MASTVSHTTYIILAFLTIISGISILRLPLSRTTRSLDYHRNFTEITAKHGYKSEEHTAVTEDGYILKLFRIVQRKHCDRKRLPVVLMHGLLQSAEAWLDAGPRNALGYLISDACHDLWLGNQRGNCHSRAHQHLNPDTDPKFWQFSSDEIGRYDIPATIDYVLNYTGAGKVKYIGYSQGSGTFFIMCSERPGYCDKVHILISLAPASRLTHTKSFAFRTLAQTIDEERTILSMSGVHEIFPKGSFSQDLLAQVCKKDTYFNIFCTTFLTIIDADHPGSITNYTMQELSTHFPAGTSIQNLARYGQSTRSDKFQKFDYGKMENLKVYNSERPPEYNLSAVTVPTVVLYGRNDHLVDPKDAKWLIRRLPNVLEAVEVQCRLWNHWDMPYSQYSRKYIFPTISEYLSKF